MSSARRFDDVAAVGERRQEARDRLAERECRIGRLLTVGALDATILSLFVSWHNVPLYQQGRRWGGCER